MAVTLSALRTGRIYPQKIHLVLIFVRGWVDPRAIVGSEGFMSMKNSMTPPGIEPATFWFVAHIYVYIYNKPSHASINKWFSCLMVGGGGRRHINYSRKKASHHEILHADYRDPLRTAVDLQDLFLTEYCFGCQAKGDMVKRVSRSRIICDKYTWNLAGTFRGRIGRSEK
jgi:hypothetical protein